MLYRGSFIPRPALTQFSHRNADVETWKLPEYTGPIPRGAGRFKILLGCFESSFTSSGKTCRQL